MYVLHVWSRESGYSCGNRFASCVHAGRTWIALNETRKRRERGNVLRCWTVSKTKVEWSEGGGRKLEIAEDKVPV
jgi:hypothetical protein